MNKKMGIRWNLRKLMASREMFQTTDLVPLLAERGMPPVPGAGLPAGHPAPAAPVDGHPGSPVRHPRLYSKRPHRG